MCPYHQWVYDLDGRLMHARHMSEDFDTSSFGLREAHCREVAGLLFVNLAKDPPDFAPFERDVVPRLSKHQIERTKVCHARTYKVKANWKVVVENSRECYHCGAGHPQYCRAVGFAAAIDSRAAAEEEAWITAARQKVLESQGIDPTPVPFLPHTWHHCRRFFLRDNFVTESMDGRPVAPLLGSVTDRNVGVLAVVTLPNLLLEVSPDYAMLLRLAPLSPLSTRVDRYWLVNEGAVEDTDFRVDRLTEFWKLTAEQDWKLCEDNQAGIHSVEYRPGPYAPDEGGVAHFGQWYVEQIS